MSEGSLGLRGFPKLVIDRDDVCGSWNRWFYKFKIAIELKAVEMGKSTRRERYVVDGTERERTVEEDRFTNRARLLVLLTAIGDDGCDALTHVGFDVDGAEATYERALQLLEKHFKRETSSFIKMQRLVTARQLAGEDEREYLSRVEGLARETRLGTTTGNEQANGAIKDVRESLIVNLAVLGLRDGVARKELMAETDLTLEGLYGKLRARRTASDSEAILQQTPTQDKAGSSTAEANPPVTSATVKQEVVGAVDVRPRPRPRPRPRQRSPRQDYHREGAAGNSGSHRSGRGSGGSPSYRRPDGRQDYYRPSPDSYYSGDWHVEQSRDHYWYPDQYYRPPANSGSGYRPASGRPGSPYRPRANSRENISSRGGHGSHDWWLVSEPRGYNSPYRTRNSSGDSYSSPGRRSGSPQSTFCRRCDMFGHRSRYCPNVRCYQCSNYGHTARDCDQKAVKFE